MSAESTARSISHEHIVNRIAYNHRETWFPIKYVVNISVENVGSQDRDGQLIVV